MYETDGFKNLFSVLIVALVVIGSVIMMGRELVKAWKSNSYDEMTVIIDKEIEYGAITLETKERGWVSMKVADITITAPDGTTDESKSIFISDTGELIVATKSAIMAPGEWKIRINAVDLVDVTVESDKNRWQAARDKIEGISRYPILSLNVSESVSGSFVLGIGRVEEKTYFVVYQVLSDGGRKLLQLPANSAIVYETLEANESAYVEIVYSLGGNIKSSRIYVPKDSIRQEYNF